MDPSLLGGRRPQLEDYEAIDRAMLDCFAESMGSMDYNGGTSFINESDDLYMPPMGVRDASFHQCNEGRSSDRKASSRKRLLSSPLNTLYQNQSNSSDCGLTTYSSESNIEHGHSTSFHKRLVSTRPENVPEVSAVAVTKSELKSQHIIVSKERRRERNKFLARKTRVKKKAEVESLWAQVSQLRTENERLKEAVRLGNPKSTDTILLDCDFQLPKKLLDLLEKMIAEEEPRSNVKYSARSFCITNATAPGDPIVYASPDFVELTGYAMHNILGHNCRFLQGPDTDRNELNKLKAAIEAGREETVIIKNYRRDGSSFWNRTQICPMRDDAGKVSLIIGLQTEVYRSYNNGEVFTLEDPLREKKANSTNGSLTGSSESNGGHGEGEGSSGNGGSEDGTTDCTNDEESHSGSTNDSE